MHIGYISQMCFIYYQLAKCWCYLEHVLQNAAADGTATCQIQMIALIVMFEKKKMVME